MYWHDFEFCSHQFRALPAGALWWNTAKLLCVSDLHLGKSERIARRSGQLVPPYDSMETIVRLKDLVDHYNPKSVVCLGDSFDDLEAGRSLGADMRQGLTTLSAGRKWIWITGNHDPGPLDLPGSWQMDHQADGLTFRHIAEEDSAPGEISGHYHPKAKLRGRRRPCFCYDSRRLILPAFGTYTGGLSASDPVIASLFEPGAKAVMTGTKSTVMPLKAA